MAVVVAVAGAMAAPTAAARPAGASPHLPVSAVRRACVAAARRAGFPVACPRGLPAGARPFWANGVGGGGGCGPARVARRRWTWVGAASFRVGGRWGSLVVASAPGHVSARRLIRALPLRASGPLVSWHRDGHTYAVSVTGRVHDRRLEARIARQVTLVVPPRLASTRPARSSG